MVNKENYYQEYKGHTKWLSLISGHNCFFVVVFWHAHSICIVRAKYERASVKALVQVDFSCMHYLSTSITPIQ